MDTIELKTNGQVVNYYVNGRNFLEMVREVELPFAEEENHPEIAGSYVELSPNQVFGDDSNLLDERGSWNGKEPLLICRECLSETCWGLFIKITISNDVVTWSGFENIHRKKWQYDKLSTFVFDKKQYLQAVQCKIYE